ncbi:MAG: hypothetical protein ACJ8CR_38720 [Roseiflexaceae bacterium]
MNVSRSIKLLGYLPLLWTGLAAIVLFWLFWDYGYDDPYITYRYAANLARGAGFVYNVSERVLSTTTPLYTLLLAGAGLAGLDVPLASNAIGCLSLALGGLALWQLGQEWQTPLAGMAGLLLYPTFPLAITTLGAETTLYLALILFGFLACAREQFGRAAVLLALATLTRADGVLAAAAAGIYVLLVARAHPWGAAAIYCALLLPWFVFAWIYFGSPLPVTLAAKQQQGQMVISRSFLDGLVMQLRSYWGLPLFRLHFVLAAVGLLFVLARRRRWLLLLGWNVLYVLGYIVLGVSGYFWYYAPLVIGFAALAGLGVTAAQRFVERRGGPRWAAAVGAALLLVLCVAQVSTLISLRRVRDSRLAIYRTVGEWLHDRIPADASVGTLEVGIIGYYAQRRMIDFAGLIQPETALRLTATTTYQDAALWAVQHFHPDYLVLQERLLPALEADVAVTTSCHTVETFAKPGYSYRLAIYQCVW